MALKERNGPRGLRIEPFRPRKARDRSLDFTSKQLISRTRGFSQVAQHLQFGSARSFQRILLGKNEPGTTFSPGSISIPSLILPVVSFLGLPQECDISRVNVQLGIENRGGHKGINSINSC
jgi:hypothetical protein